MVQGLQTGDDSDRIDFFRITLEYLNTIFIFAIRLIASGLFLMRK